MGALDAAMDAKLAAAAAAANTSAVSSVNTTTLEGIAVASDPALRALQTAANKAAIDAANNWGNGPDARYDQRVAANAAQAYADALDKALFAQKATQTAAPVETTTTTTTTTVTPIVTTVYPTPSYSAPSNSSPSTSTATPAIKTATPQFLLFNDDEIPVDAMVDLLFENIGGQELLTIARADTVNGQKILYQPIKNLNILKEQYNPNNIVRLQNTSDKFFSNFSIKLSDKIPVVGNGPNGTNVYLDSSGNLVIEFVNLANDEQAEIEITSSGIINEVGI